jgi:hypothetical protein
MFARGVTADFEVFQELGKCSGVLPVHVQTGVLSFIPVLLIDDRRLFGNCLSV